MNVQDTLQYRTQKTEKAQNCRLLVMEPPKSRPQAPAASTALPVSQGQEPSKPLVETLAQYHQWPSKGQVPKRDVDLFRTVCFLR